MKIQIVGKQRKQGTFEGNSYDNTYLHFLCDEFLPADFLGSQAGKLKVKTCDVPVNCTIGSVVEVQYNAYGKVLGLRCCEKGE